MTNRAGMRVERDVAPADRHADSSSRASIGGHPIHPMLVVFPIGLWVFSLVADLIFLTGGRPLWSEIAFYTMAGGIIGALAAAIPGAIDLFSMSDAKIKRIGVIHMAINLAVVVLYALNLWWRTGTDGGATGPVWLSVVSVIALAVSGWLGGEMVYVHGAAVQPAARQPQPERR